MKFYFYSFRSRDIYSFVKLSEFIHAYSYLDLSMLTALFLWFDLISFVPCKLITLALSKCVATGY